jgi:hypothetical protein
MRPAGHRGKERLRGMPNRKKRCPPADSSPLVALENGAPPTAHGRRSPCPKPRKSAAAAHRSWSTTVPITPEDYELAVFTIARMIARWWDASGRKMPDTEQQRPGLSGTDGL